MTWQHAGDADSFQVWYKETGEDDNTAITVDAGGSPSTITVPKDATSYTIKVIAIMHGVESDPSEAVTATSSEYSIYRLWEIFQRKEKFSDSKMKPDLCLHLIRYSMPHRCYYSLQGL